LARIASALHAEITIASWINFLAILRRRTMNIRTNLKAGAACYTVQGGDTLSSIAYKFCGNSNSSTVNTIYYANKTTIGADKNLIKPGQKLYIPDCP
jgi:phage tail protein X